MKPVTRQKCYESLPLVIDNKYSVLLDTIANDDEEGIHDQQIIPIPKPPPIFVHGVTDYQKMTECLLILAETTKTLANNAIKINVNAANVNRSIQKIY